MWSDPTLHAIECEWLYACSGGSSTWKPHVDVKCYAQGPTLPPQN